jgi:hypothetical protein
VLNRPSDPRTDDTIVYDVLRSTQGAAQAEVVGSATFSGGRFRVDAPGDIGVAITEQLQRAFVDRVQADERPRGYRRTGRGSVDMLVPGMPEHFIARMRGLWLAYPDGSVITAREALPETRRPVVPASEPAVLPTDARQRRGTLAESERILNARPLVRSNPPATGVRPGNEPVNRTDCGWIT